MLRGDIRFVNVEATIGAEAHKRRPAVIVSNDGANAAAASLDLGVVAVFPVIPLLWEMAPRGIVVP